MTALLLIHLALTWALVGLIWTIQIVHYPLFKDVGNEKFIIYHQRHMDLISWVVGPLMLTEIGSAGVLFFLGERSLAFLISLAALGMVWLSTAFTQIPLHQALTSGYDPRAIDRLVRTNWWRTAAWTLRGVCLVVLLMQKFH